MKGMKLVVLMLAVVLTLPAVGQKLMVDAAKSSLTWTGKKVTGKHYGSIQLESGWVKISNKVMSEGKFVIDMKTIMNDDLEGEMKAKLEGHLKSDDFFGVDKYPKAILNVNTSEAINSEGFKVLGDLTIKGITHPITFMAMEKDGKYVGKIIVDRSKYNVRYGSGTFFDNLGDKTIYDEFTLDVVIATK